MPVEFQTYKPGRKIRIKIVAATVCDGQDVNVGDEITASQDDALTLIGTNKAVALDPNSPGYFQPRTGPDSPPVPDGTYTHQRPQGGRPLDGTDGERDEEDRYADGSIKEKPVDSIGAHPKVKTFYEDATTAKPHGQANGKKGNGGSTSSAKPTPGPQPSKVTPAADGARPAGETNPAAKTQA